VSGVEIRIGKHVLDNREFAIARIKSLKEKEETMDRMWSIEDVQGCKEDMNNLMEDFEIGVGLAFGNVRSRPEITSEEYRGLVSELLGCIDSMKEGIIGWGGIANRGGCRARV